MPVPGPLEHSVLEVALAVGDGAVDRVAGPNLLEHSGVSEPVDPPSTSHPRIHSEVSEEGGNGQPKYMREENTLRDVRREDKRSSSEDGEAIVVVAVGSAAPWFLTGWAEEVEVEFMIDTGCQVTILATSVFKRMCAADICSGQYWIGWPAGYGSPTVMFATSVGFMYGAIVGRRPINVTIAPAETKP